MQEPVSSIPQVAPGPPGPSREPLSTTARVAIVVFVVFFHVGGGWALTQFEPLPLIVGDVAPMEVRMVPADAPAQPEIEDSEPPPPVDLRDILATPARQRTIVRDELTAIVEKFGDDRRTEITALPDEIGDRLLHLRRVEARA